MALVKCKECGQEVSQKAGSCPKCGAPIEKKTSLLTWIVAISAGVWLIGYLGNLSNSPTGTSSKSSTSSSSKGTTEIYKLEEIACIGYTSYTVWYALYISQLDQSGNNPYINQPPDAAYLLVNLTVRNNDTKARTIAPFKLIDENGSEYETSSKAWLMDGHIGTLSSLNPGVEKKGHIVFDVPRGKHYKLVISGGYWSADKALVDLGL